MGRVHRWGMGLALVVGCSVDVDANDDGFGPGGPASGASGASSVGSSGESSSGEASSSTPDGSEAEAGGSSNGASGSEGTSTNEGTSDDSGTSSPGDESTSQGIETEGGGTDLDPGLDVPDRGEQCDTPGSLSECPGLEVCRFYSSTESRCESCEECGNLGDSCSEGTDCDILFACYYGQCTNICPLGTSYCGAPEDCIDVGHPTHGVCAPF